MSWREKKIEHTGILFLEAPMSLSFVVTCLLSCNIKKTKKNKKICECLCPVSIQIRAYWLHFIIE